jgi:hypothetical protein
MDAGLVWSPFAAPVRFAELDDSTDDWLGSLSSDETTVLFNRWIDTTLVNDLFIATRADRFSAFNPPTPLDMLNTTSDEERPSLTRDGLTLFFSSDRPGGEGNRDIWMATRDAVGDPFDGPINVSELNSPGTEQGPEISSDGLRLYFDDFGRIYVAERASAADAFGPPTPFLELDAPGSDDRFITLTDDELTAVFASERGGGSRLDLYLTTRSSLTAPFGEPQRIDEVSSAFDDTQPHISGDGARLYLNYNTAMEGGRNADVWVAERFLR